MLTKAAAGRSHARLWTKSFMLADVVKLVLRVVLMNAVQAPVSLKVVAFEGVNRKRMTKTEDKQFGTSGLHAS